MGPPPQLTTQDARSGCPLDHQVALCYPLNRTVCPSIFHRIPNNSPALPDVLSVPVLYALPIHLRLLVTNDTRRAISRMASASARPFTQFYFQRPQADPLPSNDVPPASGNPSPSRNTQDSSNTQDDTAAKSKRNRAYPDKEGDGRTASSAYRKRLTSTRPGVGQDTGRAESSLPSGLHSSSQPAPADGTSREDGATGKLNGKTSFKAKEESPWRSYDEGYDLRVGGLVTVAKKKRQVSQMAESRPASEVAIRKLSGSSRNNNLSTLLRVQGEYFVKCIEAYEFGADLYVVLEHMPISLVQVIAAPVHLRETHVAAIVGQVGFQPVSP